ncbi:hypothetical protein, partial [Litorivivens sp.]
TMANAVSDLADLVGKSCVLGLSYYNPAGEVLNQRMLAARVQSAGDEGIVLRPLQDERDFTLPPELSCWFIAPKGTFTDSEEQTIENPDFLVTWDVHRKKETGDEGEHEWWEWVPCTVPPTVG